MGLTLRSYFPAIVYLFFMLTKVISLLSAENTGKGLNLLIRGSCAQRCQNIKLKVENLLTSLAKCLMKKYRFGFF